MRPPGQGSYSAELVERSTGQRQTIDLTQYSLTWQRRKNTPAAAFLTTTGAVNNAGWCCPWSLEEWEQTLEIYRDNEKVGAFDYHSIFHDTNTNADVLYFTTRMAIAQRRLWSADYTFSHEATAAFSRVLDEADTADSLNMGRQPIPLEYSPTINGYATKSLGRAFGQLTAGTLDYTEYTHKANNHVVRYGNIYYDTGLTLLESDWETQAPSVGVDGFRKVSAVVVTNNAEGVTDGTDITGWWPKNSDGTIKTDTNKRYLPVVIEQKDVTTVGEATEIARRNWVNRRTGKIIQTRGEAKLSAAFPSDVNTLYPGALFNVNIGAGCTAAKGTYALETLEFDVDGGIEVSVKADLQER